MPYNRLNMLQVSTIQVSCHQRPVQFDSTVVKLVIAGNICLYPRCLQQALSPLIHFWVLFRDNHSITGHMHEELHDALDIVTKMGSVSHENPKMHYSNSHASSQTISQVSSMCLQKNKTLGSDLISTMSCKRTNYTVYL